AASITAVMPVRKTNRTASACSAKASAGASSPSLSPTLRLNIGMKAEANAPSAKKARNMLGRRNATRNASDAKLAPTNVAWSESRTSARTRLTSVSPPIEPRLRASFIGARGGGELAWCASPPAQASGVACDLALLLGAGLGALLQVDAGEVDRLEHQRRETAVADRIGDHAACEGEQDARRFAEQEGLHLLR